MDSVNFKTFQVYSSSEFTQNFKWTINYFKTFQVYSSFER